MRPVTIAFAFPDLASTKKRAEERNRPVELRRLEQTLEDARTAIEKYLGVGSVASMGCEGYAQCSADRIGVLAALAEHLRPSAGDSAWGVGLTIPEAQAALCASLRRGGRPVVYTPTDEEVELHKAEAASSKPSRFDLEARLRDHADRYAKRIEEARTTKVRDLSGARARAAAALQQLRTSGRLQDMAERDPASYQATMALAAAAQECLAKSSTYHGLPIPKLPRLPGMPVGTVAHGKIKVSTPDGDKWRSGRKGMVRSNEPAATGGRAGFPQSGAEASS